MLFFVVFIFIFFHIMLLIFFVTKQRRHLNLYRQFFRARKKPYTDDSPDNLQPIAASTNRYRFKPKPPWVTDEVIRIKALMMNASCRKISAAFNRLYKNSRNMTVSKTFVCEKIKQHLHQIHFLHKQIKHQSPKPVPRQLIWGVDLTYKTDYQKQQHPVLGIIEHHSRKNLTLSALKDKATLTLLQHIIHACQQYGKPKIIRTDNEAVFTSRLFRLTLWLLDIRHQKTDKHCPWQNGRIERFFGTLKQHLNHWPVDSLQQFNHDLHLFRFWYNKIRTHDNLNSRTPYEVWNNIDIDQRKTKDVYYFNEWNGLLTGFYHPP